MIIAVASGKGGTGKTTVAVNLALALLPRPVTFLDADVEEPNAALFLQPTIEQRARVGLLIPEIDAATCTLCGECAHVCRYHALAVVGQQVLLFPELCHGCGSCALSCAPGAIRDAFHPIGTVALGHAHGMRYAEGVLDIGQTMATPVIRQLKEKGMPHPVGDGIVIVDASPGTACPVVEAMRGADLALLVTEPTPFGLHDLRLAVQVAREELRLPVAVVINRDGIGDQGVDAYCAAEALPVVMRLPFDREIAVAYSEGVSLVVAQPSYLPAFLTLYERLEACLAEVCG